MKSTLHPLQSALVCSLFFISFSLKAQYVTIRDTNFVKWLNNNGFTPCMYGNQLDTTCPAVTGTYSMVCDTQQIADLTGIQYFSNLNYLECTYNHLDSLPALPPLLNSLVCNNNRITSLPPLPDSLTYLNCTYNKLDSLPVLPVQLTTLMCDYNKLASLPLLPPNLNYLSCDSNLLTSLPVLPNSLNHLSCTINHLSVLPLLDTTLTYLFCGNNQVTSLPPLPASLQSLSCDLNQLTALPPLPDSLNYLACDNNQLSSLPSLPVALNWLDCSVNYITILPVLPATLKNLICGNNGLSALPALPPSLTELNCNNNQLGGLPALPITLQYLDCSADGLNNLPALPNNLIELYCEENQLNSLPALPPFLSAFNCSDDSLSALPALPGTLWQFICSYNQLTSLPLLPDSLFEFDCSYNTGLNCMPPLQWFTGPYYFFSIEGTRVACLPNAILTYVPVPQIDALPICGANSGCPIFWNIEGEVFQDNNGNCMLDSGEGQLTPMKINLYEGNTLIQSAYYPGYYTFKTGLSSYTVELDTTNLPFTTTCSTDGTINVASLDSLYHINFGLDCKPGFDVGVGYIIGRFRAAHYTTLHIGAGDISNLFGGHCAANVYGNVAVTITGPAHYVSPATGALIPTSVIGDSITWVITDFDRANANQSFNIIVEADTTAQIADQVCVTVSVTPTLGDYDTSNNVVTQCFGVLSSYDPNEKEVSPPGDFFSANQWLTYTIYFQNTGNDTAQNIYVADTLDNNLDPTTFQYLSGSAKTSTQVTGNVVLFQMPNINLPDNSGNNPLSEGYVQYRVKTKANISAGAQIQNTAWVYFDFNPPVATDTTSSTYSRSDAGVSGISAQNIRLDIFPNPSTGLLNIKPSGFIPQWINIYDLQGRKINSQPFTPAINIGNLTAGIYFIEVKNEAVAIRQKVVKLSWQ